MSWRCICCSAGVWVSLTLVFLLHKSMHIPWCPMRHNCAFELNLEDAPRRRALIHDGETVVVKEVQVSKHLASLLPEKNVIKFLRMSCMPSMVPWEEKIDRSHTRRENRLSACLRIGGGALVHVPLISTHGGFIYKYLLSSISTVLAVLPAFFIFAPYVWLRFPTDPLWKFLSPLVSAGSVHHSECLRFKSTRGNILGMYMIIGCWDARTGLTKVEGKLLSLCQPHKEFDALRKAEISQEKPNMDYAYHDPVSESDHQ
ncbi:hypothetical protein EDD85DRAFT_794360 [Armillaria nabsnona]|nr:hypothetical protein EDD85DRAFT_794360 [Armillaria nabsnona]